jgi:hypothetical protein
VRSRRSHWSHQVRRFMADSTAPPVFFILHHVTGRFRRTWIAGRNVLVA